jgi:DNA invertase Pin-like site-specific DNA recombinase
VIHAYFQCQYAEKENIEVVNQYLIEGESAHKGGRKKFQAAMDEAINLAEKSGETIALLMTEDDRYCRNMFHDSMLKFEKAKDAKQLELHLIYLNEIINYKTDPDRVIQFRIRRGMAEHESAKKSKKVKRTIKYKVDAGMFPGGLTPTGYLNEDKQILIDPKRAPFIKRIFKLFLTGKYSQSAITKLMRKEGFTVKTKKVRINGKLKKRPAKLITQSDIFRILREPFYFGKFYYMNSETNERELYPEEGIAKNYKPLFDDWKMFETVQKMLENEDRSKRQHKDENEEWAKFRGLITCGFCGCQLTPENSGNTWKNDSNRKGKYYYCTSGKMHNDPDYYKDKFGAENHSGVRVIKRGENKGKTKVVCPSFPWWKEDELEELILVEFADMNYSEEVFELMREQLDFDYQDRAEAAANQVKAAKDKHTKNKDMIKAIVHSMAQETDDELRAAYREEWEALKTEQKELLEDIRIFEEAAAIDTDEVIKKLRYCSNLEDQYQQLDNKGKKELLSVCFREISAKKGNIKGKKPNGINVVWNEPFRMVMEFNFDELVAEDEAARKAVTDIKEMGPFPKRSVLGTYPLYKK